MARAELIGIDWGTTSLRSYLIGPDATILERRESKSGILAVAGGRFGATLDAEIVDWVGAAGRLPVILSGMIGSRQGWHEVPYVSCPAGLAEISAGLVDVPGQRDARLVIAPGLSAEAAGVPDVMRGEETQILGAIASGSGDGDVVLPGTHSKWAVVRDERIVGFKTYMTGELYAAAKDHTILGRLIEPDTADDRDAFVRGVRAGAAEGGSGALLHRLFSARTLGLFGHLSGRQIGPYLSGLLIGAEIGDRPRPSRPVTIIAGSALADRYELAASSLDIATRRAPADCVAAGHHAVARRAGLIGGRA